MPRRSMPNFSPKTGAPGSLSTSTRAICLLEMGGLAASHAINVLSEQGLIPLAKFSGSDGFHLMCGVPDLNGITADQLWQSERAVVRAVACEVERRLAYDPAADPLRQAV